MRITAFIVILPFLILGAIDINFLWLFGKSPKISDVKNPNINFTSEIYSCDGKQIGTFFSENRTPAEFKDLPPNLINALLATEDVRFYQHHGIDFKAVISAMWSTARGDKRGGSTITQQLVKNMFKTRVEYSRGLLGRIPGVSTIIVKLKEWITAIKIEMHYSKDEIILMYLNAVEFGHNAFGINSAANRYFNKVPIQLTYGESSVLVGMLKAVTYYDPINFPDRALERRNHVIGQLQKYNYINAHQADSLKQERLNLDIVDEEDPKDNKSYLRDAVIREVRDWAKKNNVNLWKDGLKIYTTIDSRMQAYAEEAVQEQMKTLQNRYDNAGNADVTRPWLDKNGKEIPDYELNLVKTMPLFEKLKKKYKGNMDSVMYALQYPHNLKAFDYHGGKDVMMSMLDSVAYHQRFFQTGFIAMEPDSGYIKAWVGGIDYNYFKFDHVEQSKRQPGSLFKAFVYTAAMDNGYGPCDKITDQPVTIKYIENGEPKEWTPRNVDRAHAGEMTLKYAFARSVNSVAVQLAQKVGWEKVIDYAKKLGITSPLAHVPSICLGTSDVSLKEMVNSYCTFVNEGKLVKPILVTRIEDKNGKVIYQAKPQANVVLSPQTAFLVQVLLRAGLTEPGGTTQGLYEYDLFKSGTEFGGKTGTSSDYTDGWFVGITPGLVAGCWTGNDNMAIHFKSSHMGEGIRTAQPVYGKFMEKVLKDPSLSFYRQKFKKPTVKIEKDYSCQTPYTPQTDSLTNAADSTGILQH